MSDLINRQDAIDRINKQREHLRPDMYPQDKIGDAAYRICAEFIERLPSAQPEPCVDTIDALNESIKHFDDLAEECRRNANIERNDYMDMRDDAAEYRQLSIWLNELKWLRERFQSQPEQRWIPCRERLPEDYTDILVWFEYFRYGDYNCLYQTYGIGSYSTEYDSWMINHETGWRKLRVLAWMPLPEPYGGD